MKWAIEIIRIVCVGALVLFTLQGFRAAFLVDKLEAAEEGKDERLFIKARAAYDKYWKQIGLTFLVFLASLAVLLSILN